MPQIVWLTTDPIRDAFAADVNQGVAAIGGTLQTVAAAAAVPHRSIDLLLWYDPEPDAQKCAVLRALCPRIVTLVTRNEQHTRLCPFRSAGAPHYYIILPFAVEEFGSIVQAVLRQPIPEQEV